MPALPPEGSPGGPAWPMPDPLTWATDQVLECGPHAEYAAEVLAAALRGKGER